MEQRTCATCRERPRMPKKNGRHGSSYCRECWNARMRAYRRANGSPKKKPQDACSRCAGPRDGRHPTYCASCWRAIGAERRARPCITCGNMRTEDDRISDSYCGPCFRDRYLRRQFGISAADYDAMLAAQGSCCAICNTEPNGRPWHVDHDHATGRVRGILCDNCNRGLGHFRDDVGFLNRAIEYLKE